MEELTASDQIIWKILQVVVDYMDVKENRYFWKSI